MKIKSSFEINYIIIVLISIIVLSPLISCRNDMQNKSYYRVGMVNTDSLKLSDKSILFKGQFVQIIQDKSTEEGTFIKVKTDSGKVYHKYISTVCWLKQGKTIYSIKDTDILILNRFQEGKAIVNTISGEELSLNEGDLVYDNESVFKGIAK